MTLLGELLKETPPNPAAAPQPKLRVRVETDRKSEPSSAFSIQCEQIRILVQQLFFSRESRSVRRVGFAPIEESAQTARLCLDVATALVEEGPYEVGLIDACVAGVPLQKRLQILSPAGVQAPWTIASRLWLAPREAWCRENSHQFTTCQNLERLSGLSAEFDFCILQCPPVSWLTARISQGCDGLVLVLTANRTRRLVAEQVKDQLNKARIPLLGTVLVERRFPVPGGLY